MKFGFPPLNKGYWSESQNFKMVQIHIKLVSGFDCMGYDTCLKIRKEMGSSNLSLKPCISDID